MHIALDFVRTNALCLSSLSPPRSPFRPREERPRAAELRPTADGWPGAGPVPCLLTPRHAAPACPALSPLSRFPFLGPRFRTADFLFFIASVCRCTPFRTFQLSLELMVGGASLSWSAWEPARGRRPLVTGRGPRRSPSVSGSVLRRSQQDEESVPPGKDYGKLSGARAFRSTCHLCYFEGPASLA